MHCTDVSVTENETPHRTPIVIWTTVFNGEFHISADGNLFSERRVSVNGVSPYTVNSSTMVDKPPGPVLLRNNQRLKKTDPLVHEVELIHANPSYAYIKLPDGKESKASLKDLAPCPRL